MALIASPGSILEYSIKNVVWYREMPDGVQTLTVPFLVFLANADIRLYVPLLFPFLSKYMTFTKYMEVKSFCLY